MPVSQDFNSWISESIRGKEVTCCAVNGLPMRRQSYTVNHTSEGPLGDLWLTFEAVSPSSPQ